ncbi:MAG: hypothetical protein WAK18_12105 [Nocardioidaceae bacterium]
MLAERSGETARSDGSHRKRRRFRLGALAVVLTVGLIVTLSFILFPDSKTPVTLPPVKPTPSNGYQTAPTDPTGQPYRAFEPNSWWNTPVPLNAPHNPYETQILDYLRTGPQSGEGCLRLAGADHNPWGQPVYWAKPGDTRYNVSGLPPSRPPELSSLRIPAKAEPANNSDGSMSVFDLKAGYVTLLTDAKYDARTDTWSASGASVAYLDSNGLIAATGQSDDPRNLGSHRGNNGATSVVRLDMVKAGLVNNVLKIASGPELANKWVFPMTGSDGDYVGNDPAVPPQGLRLRIKPDINLDRMGLHPQALVIAKALQQYGMYLGDSGGTTALKLENTVKEGRGQLWDVTAEDLCGLPFTPRYWDVLPGGYDPSGN